MKSRLLLTNLAVLIGSCVLGGGPPDDMRRLAGSWSAVIIETGGKESTLEERDRLKMRLTIRPDGGYTLYFGPEQAATGVIRLNPKTTPASIDVIPADGPNKGKTQPGIYAFQGDGLWTAFAEPGQPRPAGFKTRAGTVETMLFYRRIK